MSEQYNQHNQTLEKSYIETYDLFIYQLLTIFQDEQTKQQLNNLLAQSSTYKVTCGLSFVTLPNDEIFDNFIKSKIKVFSHKSEETKRFSESLFGEGFCLKNVLNNQPDEIKSIIWSSLHAIFVRAEYLKDESKINNERVKKITDMMYALKCVKAPVSAQQKGYMPSANAGKKTLQSLLGVELNQDTNEMMDDIVKSFETVLSKSSGNPMSAIMEISQKISTKYANKINNKDIELDKIMDSMTKKVPGMGEIMKSMQGSQKEEKEKILIDENFSTANIEVGMNKEEENNIDITKMLKMADQFGVLPGGKQANPDQMPDLGSIPGFGKIMEMMGKMDSAQNNDDVLKLKGEMDTYLQNELGVDVTELNRQIEDVTKSIDKSELN